MASRTSVSLGTHFEGFVAQQLEQGRYGSASEVILAGLRLLEDRESHMAALRRTLEEGERSGFVDYSLDGLIAELDADA